MVAPAANQVAEELGITSNALIAMTTSIFVLGYGEFLTASGVHADFQLLLHE